MEGLQPAAATGGQPTRSASRPNLIADFFRRNWPLLGFGWLMAFCSGFGQTYFISIFGGAIRGELGLDHAIYGSCYSAGTIASAVVLLWVGRLIDRVDLRLFSLAAVVGLAVATSIMSTAGSVAGLTFAFFALRFFGQGLMSHSAMTTMGRYFHAERGRALSFAVTGHVAGGALLPVVGVALMVLLGWRAVWLVGGAALLLVTAPIVFALLSRAREVVSAPARPTAPAAPAAPAGGPSVPSGNPDWSLGEVIRDPSLYARLGVLLAPAFITTGLIFHQVHLGGQKGWDLSLIATGLSVYALGSFIMTLIAGPLIDRLSARRLVPFALLPLVASSALLALVGSSPVGAFAFFITMGLGTGMSQVMGGAVWAELYGTRHLGAIRAFTASGSVFSSGLAPGIVGVLVDTGWTVEAIALCLAVYCVVASLIAWMFVAPPKKSPGPE
jgi:MFS family permease